MSLRIDIPHQLYSNDGGNTVNRRNYISKKERQDILKRGLDPLEFEYLLEHEHLPGMQKYQHPLDVIEEMNNQGETRNRGGRPKGSKDTKKRKSREQKQ